MPERGSILLYTRDPKLLNEINTEEWNINPSAVSKESKLRLSQLLNCGSPQGMEVESAWEKENDGLVLVYKSSENGSAN